jgi:TatD DNase family protein
MPIRIVRSNWRCYPRCFDFAKLYLRMIDTHIHLDSDRYQNPEAVCWRALQRGVEAIVVPGIGIASNARVLQMAEQFAGLVYPALGLHPELPVLERRDLGVWEESVRRNRNRICAVGEVGLPYYGASAADPERRALAREIVERAASLARELDLALILHAPHETAITALQIASCAGARRVVFHWHKAGEATTRAIVEAGFFVSVTPDVVRRQRDREAVRIAPLDRIVVETDGPYPHESAFPGCQTEPWMVSAAIDAIAQIKGIDPEEAAAVTSLNARRLFALDRLQPKGDV